MLNLFLTPGFRIAEREAAALHELETATRLLLLRYAIPHEVAAPVCGGEPAPCPAG
jgi:hypothetical protein